MRINLGCGPVQPDGWVNVDGSHRAWLASRVAWLDRWLVACRLIPPTEFSPRTVYAHLLRPFPWPTGSVAACYLGEILEHFTADEGRFVLGECRRILQPDGRIRIRVPDHAHFWAQYLAQYHAMQAMPPAAWGLSHTTWTAMSFATICTTRPKPWQSMGHFHKWMYDDVSLIVTLRQLGFVDAARRTFHDSDIPGIAAVEVRDDLIVEARAP